jgi:ABC-2 type transport system ATP-binding protein
MAAIEIDGLVKRYGPTEAVAGISLEVERGEVFALLGPNGAGKTTTVEILEGHRRRDAGSVRVLGSDPESGGRGLRERIGIVLQSSGIDGQLTVRETLDLYGALYPEGRRADEVMEIVGLDDRPDVLVKTLSGGQRRRLDLGLGIVGKPELIFLDEPTTGFDPSARRRAWELVRALRSLGTTILLTTHYMDEAQHLSDRVGVLVAGRIVAEGPPASLGSAIRARTRVSFQLPPGVPVGELPAPFTGEQAPDGRVSREVVDATAALHAVTAWALQRGIRLHGLQVAQPTLEDVYLALTEGEAAK